MRQNMYCHACDNDFSVDINMQADGNHVFKCPHCQHEHCRVAKNGEITSERWDRRNGNLGMVYRPIVYSSAYTSGGYQSFAGDSWASSTTASAY